VSIVIDKLSIMIDIAFNLHYFLMLMGSVDDELRRQIMEQLQERKGAGLRVVQIAADLEVEPATVYQLLGGHTTPTAKVVCNACRRLKMSFQLDGHRISATDFPAVPDNAVTAVQLDLFEMTASSTAEQLNVKIVSKKLPHVSVQVGLRVAG